MSDVAIVFLCIILSLIGFAINSKHKNRVVHGIILFLGGSLILTLINVIFNLPTVFIYVSIISFFVGYLLSFLNVIFYINAVLFLLTGVLCFSSHSNQYWMAFCFVFLFFSGYYSLQYFKPRSIIRLMMNISVGLLLYYIISLIMNPEIWFNGCLIGLIALNSGLLLHHFKIHFAFGIVPILFFLVVALIIYPDFSIHISKEKLPAHQLDEFNFKSQNNTEYLFKIDTGVVLLETWHQYCTKCFESMGDLHTEFLNEEKEYPFKHYYLFVGDDMLDDSVYHFKYLPFKTQQILIDSGQDYYKTLHMQGAPYFNFYKSGVYVFSVSGYDSRYKDRYIKFFKQQLNELTHSK